MDADSGDRALKAASRASAAQLEFDAQTRRFEEAKARRETLRDSAFARLQAKLDTMPVIEQAKGILMAQNGCGPEEAFDLLRRASQRANVKVIVLAAEIVEQVSSHDRRPAESLPRPAVGGVTGRHR